MEYRTVGHSGLQVSAIGLGCNNFGMRLDQVESSAVVAAALDVGITFFDTSDSYGEGASEEYLGAAVGHRRDDVVIATKFSSRMGPGPYQSGASRKYLTKACEASLRRLQTDYLDLYYQHWVDPLTPIEETLDTLDSLVRMGKVRYIGCSNVASWELARADHVARERGRQRFVACQNQWSLLHRDIEAEVVPACTAYGVGIIPYFPLASGLLTGKYGKDREYPVGSRLATLPYFRKMATDDAFAAVERLQLVSDSMGRSLTDVALSWLLHQPMVAGILVGATTASQVATNALATELSLSIEELAAISQAASLE